MEGWEVQHSWRKLKRLLTKLTKNYKFWTWSWPLPPADLLIVLPFSFNLFRKHLLTVVGPPVPLCLRTESLIFLKPSLSPINFPLQIFLNHKKNLYPLKVLDSSFCRIWCTRWRAGSLSSARWGSTHSPWTSKSAPFRFSPSMISSSKPSTSGWKFQLCDGQDCVQRRVYPDEGRRRAVNPRLCNQYFSPCWGGEAGNLDLWNDNLEDDSNWLWIFSIPPSTWTTVLPGSR